MKVTCNTAWRHAALPVLLPLHLTVQNASLRSLQHRCTRCLAERQGNAANQTYAHLMMRARFASLQT